MKEKIWYHCWMPNSKVFGFATINGKVTNAPQREWIGMEVSDLRPFFLINQAKVNEVCRYTY